MKGEKIKIWFMLQLKMKMFEQCKKLLEWSCAPSSHIHYEVTFLSLSLTLFLLDCSAR